MRPLKKTLCEEKSGSYSSLFSSILTLPQGEILQ